MITDCESEEINKKKWTLEYCMGSMFKTTGNKDCLFTTENAKRWKSETAQEDMMDTNPWGRVPHRSRKRNGIGHEEGETESRETKTQACTGNNTNDMTKMSGSMQGGMRIQMKFHGKIPGKETKMPIGSQ